MNSQRLLTEAFRQLSSNSFSYNVIVPGKVSAVEKTSCSVQFIKSDVEVDGIRLKATPDDGGNFLIHYPKVGSRVLVGLLDEEYEGVILACDEVDSIRYQHGKAVYECSKDGLSFTTGGQDSHFSVRDKILLERGGVSLKKILEDMKGIINQIVTTPIPPSAGAPAGIIALPPSPPNPPLVGKITALGTQIDQLLA